MKPTPQEYAKQLIEKYAPIMPNEDWRYKATQCAIIDVQNTILELMWLNILCTFNNYMKSHFETKIEYFQSVKTELEKL